MSALVCPPPSAPPSRIHIMPTSTSAMHHHHPAHRAASSGPAAASAAPSPASPPSRIFRSTPSTTPLSSSSFGATGPARFYPSPASSASPFTAPWSPYGGYPTAPLASATAHPALKRAMSADEDEEPEPEPTRTARPQRSKKRQATEDVVMANFANLRLSASRARPDSPPRPGKRTAEAAELEVSDAPTTPVEDMDTTGGDEEEEKVCSPPVAKQRRIVPPAGGRRASRHGPLAAQFHHHHHHHDDGSDADSASSVSDMDVVGAAPAPRSRRATSPPIKRRLRSHASSSSPTTDDASNMQLTPFRPVVRAGGFEIDADVLDSLHERFGDRIPRHVLESPVAMAQLARSVAQGLPIPARLLMAAVSPSVGGAGSERAMGLDGSGDAILGRIEELPDDWHDDAAMVTAPLYEPIIIEAEDDDASSDDDDDNDRLRMSSSPVIIRGQASSPTMDAVTHDVESMDLDDA
ncbi:hypothetical protein H9P43_005094 [Blastocladiella emersonii ATCC 22665]|nr:hypothetical protein H9P43_005094 [Blastocladiella emersonii ATCC 22665]